MSSQDETPRPPSPSRYVHARYERQRAILRFLMRAVGFTLLAKLGRVEGLEYFPRRGPGILMINHIAFLDPVVVMHVSPRNIVPLAKVEVYNYPVWGYFTRLWEVIPVHREDVDRRAIQKALDVLRAGEMILVAPEATRGPQMRQGKEGVAYLASRSGAMVVPVALEGTDGFPSPPFSRAWRGPGAQVRFGRPFRFRGQYARAGGEQLRQMTDEAMFVLAGMLPEARRGFYADLSQATQDTIEWPVMDV